MKRGFEEEEEEDGEKKLGENGRRSFGLALGQGNRVQSLGFLKDCLRSHYYWDGIIMELGLNRLPPCLISPLPRL